MAGVGKGGGGKGGERGGKGNGKREGGVVLLLLLSLFSLSSPLTLLSSPCLREIRTTEPGPSVLGLRNINEHELGVERGSGNMDGLGRVRE